MGGPYNVVGDQLVPSKYSWGEKVDIMMMDQPSGVGYSFVGNKTCYPQDLEQSTSHMFEALEVIFNDPKMGLLGKTFFIFGESYAGTYIPLIAKKIVDSK